MGTRIQAQASGTQQSDTSSASSEILQRPQAPKSQLEDFKEREVTQNHNRLNRFRDSKFNQNFSRIPLGAAPVSHVQTKLTVGPAEDKYEREADQVASQVMAMPGPANLRPNIQPLRPQSKPRNLGATLQRMAESEALQDDDDDEAVQAKPLSNGGLSHLIGEKIQRQAEDDDENVQAKPLLGKGFNPLLEDRLQRQTEEDDDENVQAKPLSGNRLTPLAKEKVQRQTNEDEENIQAKRAPSSAPGITSGVEQGIRGSQGGGQPLPLPTRDFMESRFNYDFSQVRVHTDGTANRLAKNLNAQAFTHKQDIYFGAGRYQPETHSGKQLLAHELTHTIQQQPASVRRFPHLKLSSPSVSQRHGSSEQKAEPVSRQIANDSPITSRSISEGALSTQNHVSLLRNAPPVSTPLDAPTSTQAASVSESSLPPQVSQNPREDTNISNTQNGAASSPQTVANSETISAASVDARLRDTGSASSQPNETPLSEVVAESPELTANQGEEAASKVDTLALAGNSDQAVVNFLEASPSQIAATQPNLGTQLDSKINQEQQSEAVNAPVLTAKTSGTVEEGVTAPDQIATSGNAQINDGVTEADPGETKAEPHEEVGAPPTNKDNEKLLDNQEDSGFLGWLRNNSQDFLKRIRTTDSTVNTSAGQRPNVNLEGEANPERMANQRGEAESQLKAQRDKATNTFKQHPGQKNIQPKAINEDKTVPVKPEAAVSIETTADTGAMDYANAPLPADVRAHADELLKPNLDANLVEAKAKTQDAASTRDTDKSAKVEQAKLDTAQANQKADKEQRDIVVSNRQKVAQQQKEGIEQSYAQVDEFMMEANKEQAANRKEIGDHVKAKEGEATKELEKGEADAAKEKQTKEREAAAKKRELENSQKNDSWWDRAVSAVKNAVKTITSAIDTIFTKLREAVKTIIEKAKNAAISLINKARTWIVDKLNKFRDWAKNQVNKYLKDRFPNLAKRINEGIDSVVDTAIEGVNIVADAAIAGVEATANGLAAALDKILSVYQTALKAAVQIAGAVITGDFSEALKVALQAACDLAGIDSKPIFDFVDRAAGQVMAILKNPKGFFNNVMAAIGGGVSNFAKNIQQHLIKGLIGWLTGALSEANISLPEVFDGKGILSMVMQILGLTYENIKAKVIKKFPPSVKVFGAVEKGIEIVQKLVTEGPMALWEEVKEKMSNLKEMVISGIKDFVIKTVVKEGIAWLLGLLTPVGAIAKLLKLIFDFVMFLVERFQQIKDFVMSVYNSVAAIASGNLSQAKKAVEDALARSLPVVISMLASLAGLGGIGKTIKNIIGKIANPVNKIVDALVTRMVNFAKKLFKKGKAAVGTILQWWKRKVHFIDKKGNAHKLFFVGKGRNARLKVKSDELFSEEFVIKIEKVFSEDPLAKSLGAADLSKCKGLQTEINSHRNRLEQAKSRKEPGQQFIEEKLNTAMDSMASSMSVLMDFLPENKPENFPVKPGDFATVPYKKTERKAEILIVSTKNVHYKIDVISTRFRKKSSEFEEAWKKGEIRTYIEGSLREQYLGSTPGKASKTGGELIKKKYKNVTPSRIRTVDGIVEVEWKKGHWHPLSDCDMSHEPVDAVDYWNSTGRHTGPKSEEVREWMLDYKNYMLEPASVNRSRGSRQNSRYKPPTK